MMISALSVMFSCPSVSLDKLLFS